MNSIDISKLKIKDIGRTVIFTDKTSKDRGTISSWNNRYIFVKFESTQTTQASRPEFLNFET